MDNLELFAEAERQLTICNSCRYCEGYCAVFPAIELRHTYAPDDVRYLANLCMDCRDCLYACQYAPPHEFGVNIPKILSEAREATYQELSWPKLPDVLTRSWFSIRVAFALAALAFALLWAFDGSGSLFSSLSGPGAFYRLIPYSVMVVAFLAFAALWAYSWLHQGRRFWQTVRPKSGGTRGMRLAALVDAVTVRYLRGGGAGCAYPTERPNTLRRWLHHGVVWGFVLDLASTCLAAIYQDVFHVAAPYPFFHPVVLLGTLGGVGIILGCGGLIALKAQSDREPTTATAVVQDLTFLTALLLVGLTGMALLAFRSTPAMGTLLAVHLGTVAAFFLTAPYSKFRHAIFRTMALMRNHVDIARDA